MKDNVRNMVVTSSTGKDFRDTEVVDGHATKSKVANATNSTTEYTTGKTATGPLGGVNTNS